MNDKLSFEKFLDFSLNIIDQLSRADVMHSYSIICNVLTEHLGWDYAEVWIRDAKHTGLIPTCIYYAVDDNAEVFANAEKSESLFIGEGFPGLAWKNKKPLWFSHISEHEDFYRQKQAKKAGFMTCLAVPFFVEDYVDGVLLVFNRNELKEDKMMMKHMLILSSYIGLHLLKKQLDLLNNPNFCNENQSVEIISKIFTARDQYTTTHENYVRFFAMKLAESMGFTDKEKHDLMIAASLHDIGKIGIPMEILSKYSPLSKEEYDLIKSHVLIGYDLIRDLSYSDEVKLMVIEHHERLDGSGYPYGKKDGEIYIGSQLLAVADVVSAMLENRPYRIAHDKRTVIAELNKYTGIKYNKEISAFAIELIKQGLFDGKKMEKVN